MANARRGVLAARVEVGRRYLVGAEGFPQHTAVGLEYLTQGAARDTPGAAQVLAECLRADELMQFDLIATVRAHVDEGWRPALIKLALWDGVHCRFHSAAERLHLLSDLEPLARDAVGALRKRPGATSFLQVLRIFSAAGFSQLDPMLAWMATQALDAGQVSVAELVLAEMHRMGGRISRDTAELCLRTMQAVDEQRPALLWPDSTLAEEALTLLAARGHAAACFLLGRALCQDADGGLTETRFKVTRNLRKGAALLLQAADAGESEAWLLLYAIHSNARSTVANPQMARFCLEKAAALGIREAQTRLGSSLLRASDSIPDTEWALDLLHQARSAGDTVAQALLQSLVLRLDGDDTCIAQEIEQVSRRDPILAVRLSLSRAFGLTKQEALTVDPVDGRRSWGLMVGANPFISQPRLSSRRAVPAKDAQAQAVLERARSLFTHVGQADHREGDYRTRALRQRRLFARLGLDERVYFVKASSLQLEALKVGTKWARNIAPLMAEYISADLVLTDADASSDSDVTEPMPEVVRAAPTKQAAGLPRQG